MHHVSKSMIFTNPLVPKRTYVGKALCIFASLAPAFHASASPNAQASGYEAILAPGCNATSFVQIPGEVDLFIGRQMLTADGKIAGVSGPNDCSGGSPDNQAKGLVYGRWALTLDRLDWITKKMSVVKVLMDTSIDPVTKHSQAAVTGGPMRGAIVMSAYDPDVVFYRGKYLVAYECTLENGKHFNVEGTSACLSVYDPRAQKLDSNTTQVIISGEALDSSHFIAAAVPELLAYRHKLYIYWSALSIDNHLFKSINIRAAELESLDGHFRVRKSGSRVVHSKDDLLTTEVWSVESTDPLSDTTVDLRALWATDTSLIAAASLGGSGCTSPSSPAKGCFRLRLVQTHNSIGPSVFNRARVVDEGSLPTNPQEYTRPVVDHDGKYWFIGHYIRPQSDGFSDARPMPSKEFWTRYNQDSILLIFPITDMSLWPAKIPALGKAKP